MTSTGFIIVTILLAILAVIIPVSWHHGYTAGYADGKEVDTGVYGDWRDDVGSNYGE